MLKIYFAGSISGGRDDAKLYEEIISHLKQYGDVLTEHVGSKNLSSKGETTITPKEIHDRDIDWVLDADLIVAEVTTASLGVGYEIGRALENGKKIVCLFRPSSDKRLSAMIEGAPGVITESYETLEEAKKIIDKHLK
jgi:nucleoside 2-deoxyribosyltransferase